MIRNKTEVVSHYENVTGDYEGFIMTSDPKSNEFWLANIVEMLEIRPERDTVLDLGAGMCKLGLLWAKTYPKARQVVPVTALVQFSRFVSFQRFISLLSNIISRQLCKRSIIRLFIPLRH